MTFVQLASCDILLLMELYLNSSQVRSLSEFSSNMAVAWFVASFVSPPEVLVSLKFFVYGILSLYSSLVLLKGVK